MSKDRDHLVGWQEIAEFSGFSITSCQRHKRDYPEMPVRKVRGTVMADRERLQEFYRDLAQGNTERWVDPPTEADPEVGEGATKGGNGRPRRAAGAAS